jgi:hypothetical protein
LGVFLSVNDWGGMGLFVFFPSFLLFVFPLIFSGPCAVPSCLFFVCDLMSRLMQATLCRFSS